MVLLSLNLSTLNHVPEYFKNGSQLNKKEVCYGGVKLRDRHGENSLNYYS